MTNLLRFETVVRDSGVELPMLVDIDSVSAAALPDGVTIDGEICDLEEPVLHRAVEVIEILTNEQLAEGHFRDCVSFTMAMSGVWLPTHKPYDRRHETKMEHDDTVIDHTALRGPVSTGTPNDERCIGFGNAKFVYGHAGYAVKTSWGTLALHKLNMNPEYSLSTLEGLMSLYEDEVVHPLTRLTSLHEGQEVLSWERSALDALALQVG